MGLFKMLDDFLEKRQLRKEKKIIEEEYQSILRDAKEFQKEVEPSINTKYYAKRITEQRKSKNKI